MKKPTSIILVIVMLAVMITGCTAPASNATEPEKETETEETQQTEEAPKTVADDYPKNPITITVAATAGGSTDTAFRLLTPYLEKELGATINIINSPTAGGWVSWKECAASDPDGYLLANVFFPLFFSCYNPELKQELRIDDFQLIANLVTDPNVIITPKDSNITTLEEFLDYVSTTKDLVCGVTGMAGDDHVALLKVMEAYPAMNENVTPLITSGVTEVITNLLGGNIDFAVCNVGDLKSLLADDSVNVICVLNEERVDLVPDIPTFNELAKELGIEAEVINGSSRGVMMKKGGDPALVEKIITAFKNALNDENLKNEYENMYYTWHGITGEEYTTYIQNQDESFKSIMYLFGW